MRLFYAINFPVAVKDRLAGIQNDLRKQAKHGHFTLYENLHLTLVFIGEVHESRTGVLYDITDGLRFEPFELRINGVGSFRRDGGDIVWAGIEENGGLQALYDGLAGRVRAAGFNVEARRYTPHLTLVREAGFREGFALSDYSKKTEPIVTAVSKISLMKSERLGGRLTYTAIR